MVAYQCCADCGEKYGTYRPGAGSHWADTCDVCDADTVITKTRDYGYLYKGIRMLTNL